MGDGFTWTSKDLDETQAKALNGWEVAKQKISSGNYDIFLLDEFTYKYSCPARHASQPQSARIYCCRSDG